MSEQQAQDREPAGIGPEIDPDELDAVEPSDAPAEQEDGPQPERTAPSDQHDQPSQVDQQGRRERPQQRTRTVATGRTGNYVAPLQSAADADALAQRVKQQALVALQRAEADTLEVTIREAVTVRAGGRPAADDQTTETQS